MRVALALLIAGCAGAQTLIDYPSQLKNTPGIPDGKYSTIAAGCTAAHAANAVLTVTLNWTGLTTQALNCNLLFTGGSLTVASGQTVTLTGTVTASPGQRIFDTSASGSSVVFGAGTAPFVSPQWWGADCFGAADSTAAIRAALGVGGVLVTKIAPNCTLKITANILVTAAGQSIQGDGVSSVIAPGSAAFNVFTAQANDLQFVNFKIAGAATDNSTTQFGIFTAAANPALRGEISGVTVDGANNGFKLDTGMNDWYIHGNTVRNAWGVISGTGYGVLLGASSQNIIADNWFYGTISTKGRHCVYVSAGSSYNTISRNHCDTFNNSNYVQNSTTAQPVNVGNVFDSNISTNTQAGNNGSAVFEAAGQAVDSLYQSNVVINSQMPCWSVDDNNQGGPGTSANNQENDYTCILSASSSTFGGRIGGASNTIVHGGVYANVSSGSVGVYPAIVVQTGAQGTVGANPALGSRFSGVHVIGNANIRSSVQINATVPLPSNTLFEGGNVFATGTVSDIENPGSATLYRGISPTYGSHQETLDINPLILPAGYIWQGASACAGSDSCTTGSGTNGTVVHTISGQATTKNQVLKIVNTDAGGDSFTLGESVAVKKFTLKGLTNSSFWNFNDVTGNLDLGQGGIFQNTVATASLGTCNGGATGTIKGVSDATSAVFNSVIVGGGSNAGVALCDGTNWRFH